MAYFNRITIWVSGQILYASDLNNEFNNIINNVPNNPTGATWGDLAYCGSSVWQRIPIGTVGYALRSNGQYPTWQPVENQGTVILNFGVAPGAANATVAVTGQSNIATSSVLQAWLAPVATSDHSVDEHRIENLKIVASTIVAGTGFTIYGECTLGHLIYGAWTVQWEWY